MWFSCINFVLQYFEGNIEYGGPLNVCIVCINTYMDY